MSRMLKVCGFVSLILMVLVTTNVRAAFLTTTNSGDLVFEVLSGSGGASIQEFGFGTPSTSSDIVDRDVIFLIELNGAIVSVSPSNIVNMGFFPAGSTLDFYNVSDFGGEFFAFSSALDGTPTPSDLVVFTDTDNSLGLGGSIVETLGVDDWILHMDDAASSDDDDNEMVIRVRVVVPVSSVSINTSLIAGPLIDNGVSRGTFDANGDSVVDEGDDGLVVTALDQAQFYEYTIHITNNGGGGALTGLPLLDTLTEDFVIDPDGEDDANGCSDGTCDGVTSSVEECVVTLSGPVLKKTVDPRHIVIEAGALDGGASCNVSVFVSTKVLTSNGKGKKAQHVFAPEACEIADTSIDGAFENTVTLNEGVKVFEKETNDLLVGPVGPLQLIPIGCP